MKMNRTAVVLAGVATVITGAAAYEFYSRDTLLGFDPEGSGTGCLEGPVPLSKGLARVIDRALLSNADSLPTNAQKAEWMRLRNRPLPTNIVRRVRTLITDGPSGMDCRNLSLAAMAAAGCGPAGGDILATLISVETNAGVVPNVACWNYNVGNQKGNHITTAPVYFLVDRRNSLDFYPSSASLTDGLSKLVTLLRRPHYAGAMEALQAGNIRQFNAALGRGGYAAFYRADNAMRARYDRLVRAGRLARHDVRS